MKVLDKAKEAGASAERQGNAIKMPFTRGRLGLVEFFKESFAQASKDHLGAFAGNLTYAAIFALFPFIIFLLSLLAIFHATHLVNTLLTKASHTLPSNMVALIGAQLRRIATTKATGAFTVGAIVAIIGALWGVSGAFRGVMEALNVMYNVQESRPFVKKYALSIVLSLMTSALLVAAGVLVVAGPSLSNYVARVTGSGRLFVVLWDIFQWPVLIAVVLLAFSLMYYFAPNVDQKFKWITPGAVMAVLFWLLYTLLFSLYVNNVGGHSFSATYGALAGIAIFMIYIHQTAYFFLLGAEMNQVIESHIPEAEGSKARGIEALPASSPWPPPAAASPAAPAASRSSSGAPASRTPAPRAAPPSSEQAASTAAAASGSLDELPQGLPSRGEAVLGRKVLAAGAALTLAGILFRWIRQGRR